nr:tail fiber domain-containing protein [Flavobacteriales bacterium]
GTGCRGTQVATGAQGGGGAPGSQVSPGSQGGGGPTGPQGPTGAPGGGGATGPQGTTGAQGGGGATGPQGTTGPSGTSNVYATAMNQYVNTNSTVLFGTVRSTSDVVAYYSSDERLKDNMSPLQGALDNVTKLNGYEFDWNSNQIIYKGHDIGVNAQEIQKFYPELVETRQDGYLAIKYEKLVAVLISAIKELNNKVDNLNK